MTAATLTAPQAPQAAASLPAPSTLPGSDATTAAPAGSPPGPGGSGGSGATPPSTGGPAVAWGAYIPGAPASMAPFAAVEQATGRKPALVNWYEHWGGTWSAFNSADYTRIWQHGSIPLITWMSDSTGAGASAGQSAYSDSQILSGRYDSYIQSWANGMRALGKPIYLRLDHEMNGNWYAWSPGVNGNTAAGYVAMWRHVHDIFTRTGATNVRWVWSPNVDYSGSTSFATEYPGDAYVDWVALDGYNFGATDKWHHWTTFTDVFRQSYNEMLALTAKPLMIAETSSVEGSAGAKAAWVTSALTSELPNNFPKVRVVLWFDQPDGHGDLRWDSSGAAFSAFTAAVAGIRFGGAVS